MYPADRQIIRNSILASITYITVHCTKIKCATSYLPILFRFSFRLKLNRSLVIYKIKIMSSFRELLFPRPGQHQTQLYPISDCLSGQFFNCHTVKPAASKVSYCFTCNAHSIPTRREISEFSLRHRKFNILFGSTIVHLSRKHLWK